MPSATITTQFDDARLACTFCGKPRHEVAKLIAGPGVFICNVCVELCDRIIADELLPEFRDWEQFTDEELLREMVRIHESHQPIETAVSGIVRRLRKRSVTWARIGEALGMTRQSAWERFSGEE